MLTEQDVLALAMTLDEDWKSFMVHLGLTEFQIREACHGGNLSWKIFRCLNRWRQRHGSQATLERFEAERERYIKSKLTTSLG